MKRHLCKRYYANGTQRYYANRKILNYFTLFAVQVFAVPSAIGQCESTLNHAHYLSTTISCLENNRKSMYILLLLVHSLEPPIHFGPDKRFPEQVICLNSSLLLTTVSGGVVWALYKYK